MNHACVRIRVASAAPLSNLPFFMASTLCVNPRRDLRVVPGMADYPSGASEEEPDLQIVDLIELMRATCLDVAESGVNNNIQLASSTICAARALKLHGKATMWLAEAEGLPADLAHMTWGKLVKYIDDPFELTWSSAEDCTLVGSYFIQLRKILTSECSALSCLFGPLITRVQLWPRSAATCCADLLQLYQANLELYSHTKSPWLK